MGRERGLGFVGFNRPGNPIDYDRDGGGNWGSATLISKTSKLTDMSVGKCSDFDCFDDFGMPFVVLIGILFLLVLRRLPTSCVSW